MVNLNPVLTFYSFNFILPLVLDPVTSIAHSIDQTTCPDVSCECSYESQGYNLKCTDESLQSLLSLSASNQVNNLIRTVTCQMCHLTRFPSKLLSIAPQVESIDFSSDEIVEIGKIPRSIHLKHLNLSNNRIKSINLTDLVVSLPNLLTLDLSNNLINQISTSSNSFGSLVTVVLSSNPINCSDLSNIPFLKAVGDNGNIFIPQNETSTPNSFIATKTEARCSPIGPLANATLTAASEFYTTGVCRTCDCLLVRESSVLVNCSNRGLTHLPAKLPSSTKIVHLENNFIRSLSAPTSWDQVIYLYLSNNAIESLEGLEGTNILKNVRSLDISSNRLSQVPAHVLKQLQIDRLLLSDNPWRCDCGTIPFQLWIQEQFGKIPDMENIRCSGPPSEYARNGLNAHSYSYNPTLAHKVIYQIGSFDLCPQPSGRSSGYKVLDGLCFILLTLTVLVLLKTTYDWWWQRKTGRLPEFFKVNS